MVAASDSCVGRPVRHQGAVCKGLQRGAMIDNWTRCGGWHQMFSRRSLENENAHTTVRSDERCVHMRYMSRDERFEFPPRPATGGRDPLRSYLPAREKYGQVCRIILLSNETCYQLPASCVGSPYRPRLVLRPREAATNHNSFRFLESLI